MSVNAYTYVTLIVVTICATVAVTLGALPGEAYAGLLGAVVGGGAGITLPTRQGQP